MMRRRPRRTARLMTVRPAIAALLTALTLLATWTPASSGRAPTYRATVLRDAYGVPHIFGRTEADVAYALGQAQCEDHLLNVVYNLHAGTGRLTEILGEGLLEADKAQRLLRHREAIERDWPKLPGVLRSYVRAFAQGVNDWLADHPDALPRQVEPFAPVDVLAALRQIQMLSGVAIAKADGNAAVGEAHPGVPPGKSNSWAVDGRKSATGKPILLIDPHWPIDGNLQLYEAHLVGGKLNVWGFMLAGTPVVDLGVTPGAAWTFTAGGADSSDAFALRLNPDNPDEYEFDGEYVPMEVRTETFRIRDGNSFRMATERFRYTRHGPVMTNTAGEPFAAGLPHWNDGRGIEQFWRMGRARTTRQFKAALAMDRLSYFNVMWATSQGDIGYLQTGDVPLRNPAYNWEQRVPGWTSDTLYQGPLPFAKLPQVENPPQHFLQNCNVAANEVTPGLKFTREDFPPGALYGHYGAYRARGSRVTDLLTLAKDLDVARARRIVFDTYVPPADLWVPDILAAVQAAGNPEDLAPAVDILRNWDRRADADSVGVTLFRFWRYAAAAMTKATIGRDQLRVTKSRTSNGGTVLTITPMSEEMQRDAVAALRAAVANLKRRYGRIDVPWGEIKRLRRGGKEWPLSGDALGRLGLDTLRATAAADLDEDHKLVIGGGQSTIGLVFLGDAPEIHAVTAYGHSNDPRSPHYADQAPLYASHRLRRVPWTQAQVREQLTAERVISSKRRVR